MNNAYPVTTPTATAVTIRSLSGRTSYGGKGRIVSALAVTNDGWFAHGGTAQAFPSNATGGLIWKVNEVNVRGLYYVPPGGCFNVQAVKAVAAAAAQQFFFVRWHEIQILFNP